MSKCEIARFDEAMRVARAFAYRHDLNEIRVEAAAELWLNAGKDYNDETTLESFLARSFIPTRKFNV